MAFATAFGALLVMIYVVATFGILLVIIGALAVAAAFAEWIALGHVRAGGVRVGPDQYPELDAMAENFSARMGIRRPEIYVVQQGLWNAFAARLVGSNVVVLYSAAIDSLLLGGRPEDLGFLLGHELGHHAAGHLDVRHRLYRLGMMVPFLPAYHRRMMELTCDRLALAAVGDAGIALRGALSMTVGTVMAGRTSLAGARAQWHAVRRDASVTVATLYSWYPHPLWRLDNLAASAEAWGLPLPADRALLPASAPMARLLAPPATTTADAPVRAAIPAPPPGFAELPPTDVTPA